MSYQINLLGLILGHMQQNHSKINIEEIPIRTLDSCIYNAKLMGILNFLER